MQALKISIVEGAVVFGVKSSTRPPTHQSRILFLDRDGVLNVDTGYPKLPGIKMRHEIIHRITDFIASRCISHVYIVSNQSGVALGKIRLREAVDAMIFILDGCSRLGLHIDGFCFDMTHPLKSRFRRLARHSSYRKPGSGMLDLLSPAGINASNLYLWGDKQTDLIAGLVHGIPPANLTLVS